MMFVGTTAKTEAEAGAGARDARQGQTPDDRASREPQQQVAPDSEEGLTRHQEAILAFERQWWTRQGAKEQMIAELFDMSATRYYQSLNAIIDKPAALAADPMLVKRLRRTRASRQQARSPRRLGFSS